MNKCAIWFSFYPLLRTVETALQLRATRPRPMQWVFQHISVDPSVYYPVAYPLVLYYLLLRCVILNCISSSKRVRTMCVCYLIVTSPSLCAQELMMSFFNDKMVDSKLTSAPGLPILAVQINDDKNFAFIEVQQVHKQCQRIPTCIYCMY